MAAPTNLTATSPRTREARLNWQDNANNEQSFRIERSTSATSGFVQIATVGAGVTPYTDKNVSSRTYYYRVRASSGAGNSAHSNAASVKVR